MRKGAILFLSAAGFLLLVSGYIFLLSPSPARAMIDAFPELKSACPLIVPYCPYGSQTTVANNGCNQEVCNAAPVVSPAPTVSIAAAPTTITEGQATTITWTSTNASSCTAANALGNGTLASSGSLFESPSAPGTYTYTISCSGSGGTSNPESTSVTVTAPSAPAISQVQNLTAIASGSSVNLSWSAATATNGVMQYLIYRSTTPGFTPSTSNRIAEGNTLLYTDSSLSPGTYYYAIVAMDMNSNLGPASAQASVTIVNTSITIQSPIIINKCKAPSLCPVPITPIFVFVLHPTASITANPTTITEGQATTITWTSTNASSCTAANALGNGTLASSGSLFESPSAPGTYTYTISCSGSGGTSNPESTSVTVTAPITIQSPIIINKCKAPSLCLQPITPISVPINSFVPANLTVTGETVSTISLSWATSTEAGNTIVDYLVYRNGNLVGIAFATSFTDTGLTASTSYGYTVAAYDASGNVSSRSASVTGKTSGAPSVSSLTSMIAAIQSATTSPQNMISTAERLGFTVATGTIAGGTPYVTIEQPPANTIVGAFIGPQY